MATRYTVAGGKWSDVAEIVVTGLAREPLRPARDCRSEGLDDPVPLDGFDLCGLLDVRCTPTATECCVAEKIRDVHNNESVATLFDHLGGAGLEEPGKADGVPQPDPEDWLNKP